MTTLKSSNDHTPPAQPEDAGFWLRLCAKLIDHGLWAFVEVILVGIGAYLNAAGHPPWLIGSGFVISTALWYVYVFHLTRQRGQTIGKMAANVRVAMPDGNLPDGPVMGRRILVEALFDLSGVIFMAIGWWLSPLIGLASVKGVLGGFAVGTLIGALDPLTVLVSRRKQAIHDIAGGTFVARLAGSPVRGFMLATVVALAAPGLTTFAIVRPLFVEAYFVPSGSMENTLQIDDRILANKLMTRLRPPQRYEIVMFTAPANVDPDRKTFVKRVVGTPGDRLQVKDGKLYRNGKAVDEPYLPEPPRYTWPEDADAGGEVIVPEGHVVVLGDNRNNSNDAHHWQRISDDKRDVVPAPFLPISAIKGKLVYRYWPPDRMGTVAQEEYNER